MTGVHDGPMVTASLSRAQVPGSVRPGARRTPECDRDTRRVAELFRISQRTVLWRYFLIFILLSKRYIRNSAEKSYDGQFFRLTVCWRPMCSVITPADSATSPRARISLASPSHGFGGQYSPYLKIRLALFGHTF